MRRSLLAALSTAALAVPFLLVLAPSASAAPPGHAWGHRNVHVCGQPGPAGGAACGAIRRDTVNAAGTVVPDDSSGPTDGFVPADIQSAYGLPAATTAVGATPQGPLVAIVDAYHAPSADQDLAYYRSTFGLPECSLANGCFRQVNQNGTTTSMPSADAGWAQEISLDLDMVSAACPDCQILLVEANSASFSDLATAVNAAATMGAVAISNSYGGSDTSNSTIAKAYNSHPGIAVTASTGDNGYGVSSPASFQNVISVGGTSLARSATNSRGWTETAWSGAGSGCSRWNPNPGYQSGTGCKGKATADVSAVADPYTGVAVYDSYAYQGTSGWMVFGGTSAASPIIASVYALGGNHGYNNPGQWTWSHRADLNDVVSGSNGRCSRSTLQLCTARKGWDGPTGLGTPYGLGSF